MNSHIDFRTLPNNVPSLCIPRVFSNWTESRIRRIFDDLGMGEIQRIDVVSKTTEKGEKFNRVFVHFKRWFSNQNADMARERLLNGKEIKIVYDDPWFWKVSAYREVKKSDHLPDRDERPRPSIRFDDDREQAQRPSLRPSQRPREQRLREEDRRPSDRQDRPQDRRQEKALRPQISKEFLDKELEKLNPTIPESMKVQTPKTVVKADQIDVGCGAVVYDMTLVNSTKRRKIVIKKDPVVQKVPLKIEAEDEEGEVSESEAEKSKLSESDWNEDGLPNVGW